MTPCAPPFVALIGACLAVADGWHLAARIVTVGLTVYPAPLLALAHVAVALIDRAVISGQCSLSGS